MIIRVITLRYDENLRAFPEEPLKMAAGIGAIIASREYFFIHGGIPHLAFVLEIDESRAISKPGIQRQNDPGDDLPERLQPLYRNLRHWRNERAKREGVPSYILFRNTQLAEICRKLPRTLSSLKEIEGIGEATCKKYGAELLSLIPADLSPEKSEMEQKK